MEVEYFSPLQPMKSMDGNFNSTAYDRRSQLHSVHPTSSYSRNPTLITPVHDNILKQVEYGDNSSITNSGGHGFTPNISSHRMGKSVDEGCSSDQHPGLFLFLGCFPCARALFEISYLFYLYSF